jgi:hypothetical protein
MMMFTTTHRFLAAATPAALAMPHWARPVGGNSSDYDLALVKRWMR